MNVRPLQFAAFRILLCAALCVLAFGAAAQELRVAFPDGTEKTWPVVQRDDARYAALNHVSEILRRLDAEASVRWNDGEGVYRAEALEREFSLDANRPVLIFDNTYVDVDQPLRVSSGRVLVPLQSLETVLRRFPGVETNLSERASGPALPPLPALPAPSDPVAAPDGPQGRAAESAALTRALQMSLDAGSGFDTADFDRATRATAATLAQRRTIVLDPQPPSEGGGEAAKLSADLTLRIAERCREHLLRRQALNVVLTRESPDDAPSLDRRVQTIRAADAAMVLCLRLDASPFAENQGYRIAVMHEAVDRPVEEQTPGDRAYQPFQSVSLQLARMLDSELARAGLPAGPESPRLAPLYLLKRAPAASAAVTLGYATSPSERERLVEEAFVESAAAALTQGLLRCDEWVRETAR